MIGLLEGMIIPQPRVSQAASGLQTETTSDGEAQSTPDVTVPQEAFLSVLCQQLVAMATPQISLTSPVIQTSESVLWTEGDSCEAGPMQQGATLGMLVRQSSRETVFPRLDNSETQQEGIVLPVSPMKATPPGTSDGEMSNHIVSETEFVPESLITQSSLGIRNSETADQLISNDETRQKSESLISAPSLPGEIRQDQSGVSVVREHGPERPSPLNLPRMIRALNPDTTMHVSVVDSALKQMPHVAGTPATPQSMAELKNVVERFSVGLSFNAAMRMIETKTSEGDAIQTSSGQQVLEQKPLSVGRMLDTERPQQFPAKAVTEKVQGVTPAARPDDSRASELKAATSTSVKLPQTETGQLVKLQMQDVQGNNAIGPKLSERNPSGEYESVVTDLTQVVEQQIIERHIVNDSAVEPRENDLSAKNQMSEKPLPLQEEGEAEAEDQNAQASSNEGAQKPVAKETTTRFEIDPASTLTRGVTTKPVVDGISAATHQPKLETSLVAKEGVRVFPNSPAIPEDFAKNLMVKISDEVKLQVEGKSSEVRVTMKPESMGELSLRVTMHEGKLVAQMDVSQLAVKNALEAQLPQMREALASQGIDIHRFDIVSGSETQFQQPSEGSAFHQHQRSKRQLDVEVTEDLDGMKYLGYNTVEYII